MCSRRIQPLFWATLALLPGCFLFGSSEPDLPPLIHSDGFFARFDHLLSRASGPTEEQIATLRNGFEQQLEQGSGPEERVAVGATWNKVSLFLEIGLSSAEILAGVPGTEDNQLAGLELAADRVLMSDFPAIDAWNQAVTDLGRPDETAHPAGEIMWESLHLLLSQSELAHRLVWVESESWVEGHWERAEGYYEEVWVPGHVTTYWQQGQCYEVYVRTDCTTYWVDEQCFDLWVEDGYWDSYCSWYDEWGSCVEWVDQWVDLGYWEIVCEPGYYWDDCYDILDTVCDPGQWVEAWVEGYYTEGPWIPGELYWVEGYWADTSAYQRQELPEQELQILKEGLALILESWDDASPLACRESLQQALESTDQEHIHEATRACLYQQQ